MTIIKAPATVVQCIWCDHPVTDPLAHRCKPPRGDRRGIALPSGVSWRCRCGIRWRLDDDIWTQLAPKGRP